jgi:hypothetical protein
MSAVLWTENDPAPIEVEGEGEDQYDFTQSYPIPTEQVNLHSFFICFQVKSGNLNTTHLLIRLPDHLHEWDCNPEWVFK